MILNKQSQSIHSLTSQLKITIEKYVFTKIVIFFVVTINVE